MKMQAMSECRQCQNSEFYGNGKKILGVTLHLENKCCKKNGNG